MLALTAAHALAAMSCLQGPSLELNAVFLPAGTAAADPWTYIDACEEASLAGAHGGASPDFGGRVFRPCS